MNKNFSKIYSIFFILLLSVSVQAQTIQLVLRGEEEKIESISSFRDNNEIYISANRMADILGINSYYEERLEKLVLVLDGIRVTLTEDNPFISIGQNIYQLQYEVIKYRSEFYFPLKNTASIFDRSLPGDYSYDEYNRIFEIFKGGGLNIIDVEVEEKSNGSLIKIKTGREFGSELVDWFDPSKNTLNLQFYKGFLDTLQLTNNDTRGLVLNTSSFQFPESAQITFKLSAYVDSYEVNEEPGNGQITVSLIHKNAQLPEFENDIDFSEEIPVSSADELVAKDRENWDIDTIVLDPGHGGRDPGTVGRDGTKEKDIVLDISLRLGKLLEQSGLFKNIVYTRDSDKYIALKRRAEIANERSGKLFVSIHINANKNSRIRGFEAYFLRPGMNDQALEVLEVVQRENNVANLYDEEADRNRDLTEEDRIILEMTQSAFVKESEMLSTSISEGLERKVNWPNKGVKQAGFQVLWDVSMPNVLVELGFITNNAQLNALKTRAIRQRLAEGIFEGIRKFKEQVGR